MRRILLPFKLPKKKKKNTNNLPRNLSHPLLVLAHLSFHHSTFFLSFSLYCHHMYGVITPELNHYSDKMLNRTKAMEPRITYKHFELLIELECWF